MNHEKFNNYMEWRQKESRSKLASKAREYSPVGEDRFKNFIERVDMQAGESVSDVIYSDLTKHLACVVNMIKGKLENTKEMREEKMGDLINYCYLLEASLLEKSELEIHAVMGPMPGDTKVSQITQEGWRTYYHDMPFQVDVPVDVFYKTYSPDDGVSYIPTVIYGYQHGWKDMRGDIRFHRKDKDNMFINAANILKWRVSEVKL